MSVGIVVNPHAPNVPTFCAAAADRLGIPQRLIDISSLSLNIEPDGTARASDGQGPIKVDSIAPYMLFGFPAAAHALRLLECNAFTQNPIDGVLIADDKAATAGRLACSGVAQVATWICPLDIDQAVQTAEKMGYPVVLKRSHGAQGRWVRRAANARSLILAYRELEVEGPTALIIQPEVVECQGRSVRVVVTAGSVLAVAERVADIDDWRSNIANGAQQTPTILTDAETELVTEAVKALNLGHAGIDMLRTTRGPRILEINSCPDFTSMEPYFEIDLAETVVMASMRPG